MTSHQSPVYTVSNDEFGFKKQDSQPSTRYEAPRRMSSRRMYIIFGVVFAVFVVAIVAVVVPVVVMGKQNSDSSSQKADKATCGPYKYPGIDIFSLKPRIISFRKYCPLKGDCWTGEQCYKCFERAEWKVGNINGIPVCCENCEVTGLAISASECNCLHNGYGK